MADRFLGAHEHDDELPPFVAAADRHHFHSRRRFGERTVVRQNVGVAGQLARFTDVMYEHILGRGHACNLGQMIDERADELRARRPLPDRAREVGIVARGMPERLLKQQIARIWR